MTTDVATAAIYVRVSLDDQVDGVSLDDQERKCRAYATAHDLDVTAVYREEGASGGKSLTDRPAGAELLEAAAMGQFSRVIVARLDRFTRSVRHGAADLDVLDGYGVGVAFLDMGIDTGTTAGKLMLNVMIAFADFERDTIRDRMVMGRAGAAEKGRWPGGPAPFGWAIDDDKMLVVDDEQTATLVRIFRMIEDGTGPKAVADLLNDEGTPTARKGGTWKHATVQAIIKRDAYQTGKVEKRQGGTRYVFPAPVLISPERWTAANKAMAAVSAKQVGRRKVRRLYALSGRLDHSSHGMPMTGRNRSASKLGRYYACTDPNTCPGLGMDGAGQLIKTLPAAKVEAHVLLWGLALLNDPGKLEDWASAYDRQALGNVGDDAKLLAQAIKMRDELQRQREEHGKALAMGLLTADELAAAQAEVDEKLADLEQRIDGLASSQGRADALRLSIGVLKSGNVGDWLTALLNAPIEYPLPQDVDPRDPQHWEMVRSALEGEAWEVLDLIANAPRSGRPTKGTPPTRDIAGWASEWVAALVQRFSLTIQVEGADPATWKVEGAVPQKLSGPGTQAVAGHVPTVRFTTTLAI